MHTLFDPFRLPPYATIPIVSSASVQAADAEFEGGPALGQVVPDMSVSIVGGAAGSSRLLDEIGHDFACLAWGGMAEENEHITDFFASLERAKLPQLPLRRLAFGTGCVISGAHVSLESDVADALFDAAPGTVYLIRPDHHVAARWRCTDSDEVAATLRQALMWSKHATNHRAEALQHAS